MPETDSSRRWPDSQALPEERTLAFRTVPSSMRRRVQHRLKASQNYQLRAATSASSVAVNLTVDTKGGFLYGTFTFHPRTGVVTNGKVTGGTGAFAGATGTIKVKTISPTKHAITITYSG